MFRQDSASNTSTLLFLSYVRVRNESDKTVQKARGDIAGDLKRIMSGSMLATKDQETHATV